MVGAPPVAVVNDVFAQRFWPGQNAIGQRFAALGREPSESGKKPTARTYEVVGVARDGKFLDIDDPPLPYFWTSLHQDHSSEVALLVKGRDSAEAMVSLLHREVEVEEGELQPVPPRTLSSMVDLQFMSLRIASAILGLGGIFGLALAAIGIYGIVSLAVTQRTRELAIRSALGARQSQLLSSVAWRGMMLAGIGVAAGLLVVLPLARLVRSLLFGMGPADPLAVGSGSGVLLLAALVASFVPALRVSRIEPTVALRED